MPIRLSKSTKRCSPSIPATSNAVKGIAYLYLQQKQFDDAKQYYNRAVQIDPNDPESYYSVAFIDWTQAYKFRQDERNKLGMKATDPLKDKKVCELVKEHNAPIGRGRHQPAQQGPPASSGL